MDFFFIMSRLNSEDFSKFFLCLDVLFLTYSDESTYLEVQKTAEIVSNILESSKKIQHFSGFLGVCFHMNSLAQKKLRKILGIQPNYSGP